MRDSIVWCASLLVLVVGCELEQGLSIGQECSLNSDCDAPLVCRLGKCRKECSTSRDCALGLDCLRDIETGFGGCQLPEETSCSLNSQCTPLVCSMGRCTTECSEDRDCAAGASCLCQDGMTPDTGCAMPACIYPNRMTCLYNTNCPDDHVCVDQQCRIECEIGAGDCRPPLTCVMFDTPEGRQRFCDPPRVADAGP